MNTALDKLFIIQRHVAACLPICLLSEAPHIRRIKGTPGLNILEIHLTSDPPKTRRISYNWANDPVADSKNMDSYQSTLTSYPPIVAAHS